MKRFDQWRVIAVGDAYRLMPWADAMYGCDPRWWQSHKDCGGFAGEKWSTHHEDDSNNKLEVADLYGVNIVQGDHGDEFSFDPGLIRYGSNSGFQAINLALLKGCRQIVLVGFDMRRVEGKAHFFGEHPAHLNNQTRYEDFAPRFVTAAAKLPNDVRIINATPGSALEAFPKLSLDAALATNLRGPDGLLHRDRAEPDAGADRDRAA